MSPARAIPRSQVWLDNLGDWAWPGRSTAAEAVLEPPAWIAAFPTRLEPSVASGDARSLPSRGRFTARALLLVVLLGALVAVSGALGVRESGLLAEGAGRVAALASSAVPQASRPLPALVPVSYDASGSAIDRVSFRSSALNGAGSFLVYLPPGYSRADHYPVLYLLHGQAGHATAFLEVGLQQALDRLIERGAIPPMLAIMIQDRKTLENWQWHSAAYVIEVQELVDRMLPTRATRGGRAIAGNSKGGFGAMHIALGNPYRFAVVESWLGYFNHLGGELARDRPALSRLGLHAFLYGATGDLAADPAENPAFAAALRAAGAHAESAIYRGNHSLTTVAEHLEEMLVFAGSSFREEQLRAAADTWSAAPAYPLTPR